MSNIREKHTTWLLCQLGIGTALYVVLSMIGALPIIGHIHLDLGYTVFGAYLVFFGIPGAVIGIIGCLIESILLNGWVPIGWMAGQGLIGIICGFMFMDKSFKNYKSQNGYYKKRTLIIAIVIVVLSVLLGVGFVKTAVECILYNIPLAVKLPKNLIASVTDSITMSVGVYIGLRLQHIVRKN